MFSFRSDHNALRNWLQLLFNQYRKAPFVVFDSQLMLLTIGGHKTVDVAENFRFKTSVDVSIIEKDCETPLH